MLTKQSVCQQVVSIVAKQASEEFLDDLVEIERPNPRLFERSELGIQRNKTIDHLETNLRLKGIDGSHGPDSQTFLL